MKQLRLRKYNYSKILIVDLVLGALSIYVESHFFILYYIQILIGDEISL